MKNDDLRNSRKDDGLKNKKWVINNDSKINNKMIHKSSIQIRSMNSLNEGEYPKQTQGRGCPKTTKGRRMMVCKRSDTKFTQI
ncbi:unnamed protein product, partial [Vitis vinifera]